MADTKLVYLDKIAIGHSSLSGDYAVIEGVIRFSERLASPDGALVKVVPVINLVNPPTIVDSHRYYEMEMELDSDNLTAMRGIEVTYGSSTTRVLRDNAKNNRVDYFATNIINQSGAIVSYTYASGQTYLVAAGGGVSNRPGTARNPSVYRFLNTGTKVVGSTEIVLNQSGDERYTGIEKVELNSGTLATNIADYGWSLVGPTGDDIVSPRFTPNVYNGIGVVEFSGKHWRFSLTFDTYTTIFDSYINVTSGQVLIPDAVNITLTKNDCTTRVHQYQSGMCYVAGYAPSNVAEKDTYHPGVIEFVCLGTRTDL